ncbi:hypothetical protein T265_15191, partial [Opisthorchis viverrini]
LVDIESKGDGKGFCYGNSRALYQLIRSIGPRRATVSETISEKDGSLIHSQKRRLERWAEHFEEQPGFWIGVSRWPAELLFEVLCPAIQMFCFAAYQGAILVPDCFTDKRFPRTSRTNQLEQFAHVSSILCIFHFFDLSGPPSFSVCADTQFHLASGDVPDGVVVANRWDLCTNLPARACNAQLPIPSPKSSVNETAAATTSLLSSPRIQAIQTHQNQPFPFLPAGPISDVDAHWRQISITVHNAETPMCDTIQLTFSSHWISGRTLVMLVARRQIQFGSVYRV